VTTPHTPVPRIQPRKGFAWLPLEQQLSVVALVALLLLALLPACIDSGRAGSGQLKAALFKPRSVAAALTRLERHYGLNWITGSAGEQRLRQKLVLAACGICAIGALAASKAQQPAMPATVTTTTPRTYGTAASIRTRAALATRMEDDHV
jgi:hypothetical protein